MLMLAILFGAAAVTLTVFGVWPAILLVIACAMLASFAWHKIKKRDQTQPQ